MTSTVITLTAGNTTVQLPGDMIMTPDPAVWLPMASQVKISLAGTPIIQVSSLSNGNRFTIASGDNFAFLFRPTLLAIQELMANAPTCTLTLIDDSHYTVQFDFERGGMTADRLITAVPVLDTHPYKATLYFVTVAA